MIRALAQLAQVLAGRPPERIVCDAHPDSTRLAAERVAQTGAKVIQVQHHHAHIAAVQAEYGADRPLPGLAPDGYRQAYEAEAVPLLESLSQPCAPLTGGWLINAVGQLDFLPLFARLADETRPQRGASLLHATQPV